MIYKIHDRSLSPLFQGGNFLKISKVCFSSASNIDRPSSLSLERWRRVCLKSLKQLEVDFDKAFGDLRREGNTYEKDISSSLASSISWFLGKKDVENTVEVVSQVPFAKEGSDEFHRMYG
jgi:hypothetical protein